MASRPGSKPNRRRQERMPIAIPVRVQGHFADGVPWEEMSVTENADFGGAAFLLKHPVALGHALHLALPLPKSLRRFDLTAPGYNLYATVRYTAQTPNGQRVGVMFIGKNPPQGFLENPGGRFLLPTDNVSAEVLRGERRRTARYDLSVSLKVRRSEPGADPVQEQTISTNIGLGGAMVFTSLALAPGDKVVLEDPEGALSVTAQVQNVYIGPDNIPRLNLRFVDGEAAEAVRRILKRSGIAAG